VSWLIYACILRRCSQQTTEVLKGIASYFEKQIENYLAKETTQSRLISWTASLGSE
jgi:hypothetical protein